MLTVEELREVLTLVVSLFLAVLVTLAAYLLVKNWERTHRLNTQSGMELQLVENSENEP